MKIQNEIDRDAPLTKFERFCVGVLLLFALVFVLACCGCKTYYENAGVRVRTGNVTAPVEVSEPTSSANAKFLFFMDGADVYVAKGYGVEIDYSAAYAGTWLTSASTQAVHVVVSSTNLCDTARTPSR